MANWNGKTLGKVKIGELIARGGMAEVYLGEHTALNRKVAVKIMRDHVDADPDNHVRFEREARVVAGLRHPNIIQVFDYELVDGQPCLIMELVSGASLGNYLKALHKRGEKLPFSMVAHILHSLASAVDYAHHQNIIHRDIKPANVLLRSANGPIDPDQPLPEDVEPILTDFGLVRLLDSSIQTSTGAVSGTPAYMSPEQARGDKVDSKTDIYSLGVMLYEMLAGVVPFDAESSFGILMKHLNEPPPPITGISSDLQAIINRALSKNSNVRYSSAKEMADEFVAVFNGQTISPETASLNRKKESEKAQGAFSKFKQAGPLAWIGVGVGVLAIGILGFIAFRSLISPNLNRNRPVGRISYNDQNALMDKATIFITNLPSLDSGHHYEVWYLAQGGERRRNVGALEIRNDEPEQLIFTNPQQENILSLFDQVEVTIEPDNDPNPDEPSDEIVASSIFPPLALIHVRHVLVSFHDAPEGIALIQGLWGAADGLYQSTDRLQQAFADGDEELFRKTNEEIINNIVGNQNKDQYRDWNEDGTIDDISDGFGLLQNGDPGYTDQGYIKQTISHANFAAQAADATRGIKEYSAQVVLCGENMTGWSEQLLEKTIQLQSMDFGPEMEPVIAEITKLSNQIVSGVDSNGNQIIEPVVGEGGATTAYEYAYFMAEMPLLPGAHRIPQPDESTKK